MNEKEFDFEGLDKAYANAVSAATFLKEEDERYKDVNPLVPLHVGLFWRRPPLHQHHVR